MASRTNRGRLRLVETQASVYDEAPAPAETPLVGPTGGWDARSPAVVSEISASSTARSSDGRGTLGALSDAQLVALGCKGDRSALEILYRRYAAYAINLATRIEGSSRDVEDIVHDAFLRAFERLGDLADRGAFKSWLGAIVVHAVRSRMRRARLMSLLGMGKGAEPIDLDAIASSDASPHTRAQIAQIYALLLTLPTDDRIAWTLRCVEGHDLETVARLTRCSLATVKRRITRAQRFLDEHFVEPKGEAASSVSDDDASIEPLKEVPS